MSLLDESAPEFTFENTAGQSVTLSETLGEGPSVVVVFRGDWCSYCTEQLQTFSALEYDLWRHLDATVLPVAGDALPRLRAMRDRYGFGMQLLSDPELSMAEWTGIEHNDDHGDILVPGTFIVDTEGMVRYEHVGDNPADRTYANYVRAAIRSHDCRDPYPPGERDRF